MAKHEQVINITRWVHKFELACLATFTVIIRFVSFYHVNPSFLCLTLIFTAQSHLAGISQFSREEKLREMPRDYTSFHWVSHIQLNYSTNHVLKFVKCSTNT
jgi:hypothetical protein